MTKEIEQTIQRVASDAHWDLLKATKDEFQFAKGKLAGIRIVAAQLGYNVTFQATVTKDEGAKLE